MQNTYGGIRVTEILLISHGQMAEGIKHTVKMLIGDVSDLHVITFGETMGIEELTEELSEFLTIHSEELLIFTDLKGGTPFNVASVLTHQKDDVKVFYGMNLPLIIEAYTTREFTNIEELTSKIEENVSDSIGFSEL